MKAVFRTLALVLLFAPAGVVAAQTEWGMAAGYGFSVHLHRGRSDEQALMLEPSVGIPLTSRLEYIMEGHFARYFTPHGWMAGWTPIGARFEIAEGRVRPYVSIGAGFGWTDLTKLEEIDRRFNFLLQASVGVRGALAKGQNWTLEARIFHISNAGTALPNLGLNSLVFLAGWRFRRFRGQP